MPDDGYLLDNLAYHLSHAGRSDELRDLLTDLRWLHTKLQSSGPVSLLADYAHLPDDPVAQVLRRALRLSAPALADDPAQLPGQLIGRLQDEHHSALDRLLDQAASWSGGPWLCPSAGALATPYGPLRLTLRPSGPVGSIAVTADNRLVCAGLDGMVRVWDLDSARELYALEGHTGWLNAVAVSADGRRVVSATSHYGTLRVWDLDSGRELRTLEGHTGWVRAVAVTADGRQVLFAGDDGMVRVWDLDSGRAGRFHGAMTG